MTSDYHMTVFLQVGEHIYTSGFHGIVTMHTEIPAFLPLVIQGYMHAQACACTVDVLALLWYTLLPQYKMHSRYAAARKRNEKT